jgi:deazaflavin-dependent oxidoreductase (nitroreductase family)
MSTVAAQFGRVVSRPVQAPMCENRRAIAFEEEGVDMPARDESLKDRLTRYKEIKITVTGRKSGRSISVPVWFVAESDDLYLLPVQGSDTQWYKNVVKKPSMRIDARGAEAELKAVPITESKKVSDVVGKFREKYGAGDVKKYYSKFDVAVRLPMR